jgi:hypothetical protein
VLAEALKAISLVYPTEPYLMEGFHRSWEKVDFTDSISYPGTLVEAAVTIYDHGYSRKKPTRVKEEIYINEVRRSAVMEGWNYKNGSALRNLLNKNLVKYPIEPAFIFLKSFLNFPNDLVYEWEGNTQLDGENISVIKIEVPNAQKFPAFYKVYISEVDHAILRFDLSGAKNEVDYALGEWHTDTLYQSYIFKRYQGKPYLRYVKLQYTIKKLDRIEKKVLRTEDYHRELLINNTIITDVEAKRKSLFAKRANESSLALQAEEYNEVFWKNYNVIKENPLDREVIKYFEQNGKLKKKRH